MPAAGTDDAGTEGSSSSTGVIMTNEAASASASASASEDSGEAGPQPSSSSEGSGSTAIDSTGPLVPECNYPNDVCDEYLVCRCSCDSDPFCCTCEETECTEDAHCGDGSVCGQIGLWTDGVRGCVPSICAEKAELQHVQISVDEVDGAICLASLLANDQFISDIGEATTVQFVYADITLQSTALGDLGGLESVADVGTLTITDNPSLTSVAQLGALVRIRDGGSIRDNPMLPADEVHALLDAIEGGDLVEVCGNLDDVPC